MQLQGYTIWLTVYLFLNEYSAAQIAVTTVDGGTNNILLSDVGAFGNSDKSLNFQIKGCRDAMLILSSQTTVQPPYYHVIIGGWSNTKSILGRRIDPYINVDTHYSTEMDCNLYKDFWIGWENGKIQAGRGNVINADVFLSYVEHCEFTIQNIEISTGPGSVIDWIIFPSVTTTQLSPASQYFIDGLFKQSKDCPTFNVVRSEITSSITVCGNLCIAEEDCRGFRHFNNSRVCEMVSEVAFTNIIATYFKVQI